MTTSDERLKILTMIQEGKLTAQEGLDLLSTLSDQVEPSDTISDSNAYRRTPRWLRVKVTDTNTGKTRVNVRMPISLVNAGVKMGAKFAPEVDGMDMSMILNAIKDGETGKVVDVFDEQDGEHVEVYID
jgi:hypothetical protein